MRTCSETGSRRHLARRGIRMSSSAPIGAREIRGRRHLLPGHGWQQCIRSAKDSLRLHRANGLHIGNLGMGMNACVGPAGTDNVYLVIEKLLKGLLKLALNRWQMGLNLPAVEICAVVSESQLEVPHSIGYSMCLGIWPCPLSRQPSSH